jgi:hypothetical protein
LASGRAGTHGRHADDFNVNVICVSSITLDRWFDQE